MQVPSRPLAAAQDAERRFRDAAVQALVIAGLLVGYLSMRVLIEGDEATAIANADDILAFEAALGLDIERGSQALVPAASTLMDVFNVIYVWFYWPLLLAALAFLWWRDLPAYRVLRNSMCVAAAIGLVVFALYPVAPPRFLAGFVDTVGDGRDGALTNQYAAMPSFHVGWLVLAAATIWPVVRNGVARGLLLAPAAVMSATVVFTANHYVVDAVVGIAISAFALWAVRQRRAGHEPRPAPGAAARETVARSGG